MGGQTSAEEKCVKREDLGFADTFQSIVLFCVMTVHEFHFPKQTCSERSSSKISHYKWVYGGACQLGVKEDGVFLHINWKLHPSLVAWPPKRMNNRWKAGFLGWCRRNNNQLQELQFPQVPQKWYSSQSHASHLHAAVSHSTPSEVQDLPPGLPYPDSTIQHLAAGRAVKFQLSVIFNLMKTIFSSQKTPKILVFLQTTKPELDVIRILCNIM